MECIFFFDLNSISNFCNSQNIQFFYNLIVKRFFSVLGLQFGFYYWSLDNKFYGWLAVCDSFCPITWHDNFFHDFPFIEILKGISLKDFINVYCTSSSNNIPINRFYVAVYDADNWGLYWELYNRMIDSISVQKPRIQWVLGQIQFDTDLSKTLEQILEEDLAHKIDHKYVKFYLQILKPQEKNDGELLTPWLIAPPERIKVV